VKVTDFKGKQWTFPPNGHMPKLDDTRKRSDLHLRARAILRSMYPTQRVLEEVSLPGTGLKADFYVPRLKMIVETHGEQHYKYVPHFHGSIEGMMLARANDSKKKDWCDLNNITYIELPFDKTDDQWKEIINDR
jgi:hypothetical protein